MGDFFTSTQIFNSDEKDREGFIENFCNKMTGEGYVTCDSDESELSYILKFADNCKWVTITSEAYEQGNKMSKEDTGRIAKMLGTTCVNTVGIDSDCAILELYDESGKKADTLIMGRADDYFGDDIPRPSEKIWKPFLSKDNTWEQFCNIVEDSDSYTFIEDGLSELASLIGMDDRNISFSADEAIDDEQTLFLYFRKAEAKKAKKLTLNAAFKQVFGEALEPLGFIKIKSKHPYYARLINGEILHVITFVKDSYYKNMFDIYAGVATIYKPLIDFDRNADWNRTWMTPIRTFEVNTTYKPSKSGINFEYELDNNASLVQILSTALERTKAYILPALDQVISLRDVIDYCWRYNGFLIGIYSAKSIYEYNRDDKETLLYFKLNDHSDMKAEYEKVKEQNKKLIEGGFGPYTFEEDCDRLEASRKDQLVKRDSVYNDKDVLNRVINEISHNQEINIKKLQNYGFNI